MDLSDLLSVNIVHTEPESQVLLDGRLVFTPSTKRNHRCVEDISSWCEAFVIFTLIFTSYFPHRWKDLTCYKLLILRTYRQFSGRVWLAYDKAFREHAAAAGIVDWSSMNVQLYNLCAAGASVCGGLDSPFNEFPEPSGAASSQVICRSWNRGRCSAQSAFCRFAHRCSSCGAAAPVVALVPVLPLRIILPTGNASAILLLLHQVRPALVPNAVEGTPSFFA